MPTQALISACVRACVFVCVSERRIYFPGGFLQNEMYRFAVIKERPTREPMAT